MSDDERAIRNLVQTWMDASLSGDVETVLSLMSNDVVFQTVGQTPFGKKEFEAGARAAGLKDMKIEAAHQIAEIKVLGDWAYLRNRISFAMTPKGRATVRREGYTLTILNKMNGRWVLTRDANLMTVVN